MLNFNKNLRILEQLTDAILELAGVAKSDVLLSVGVVPPHIGGFFEVTEDGPVIVVNELHLHMFDNPWDVLFIFAHELGHYIQWRDGRLAPCSSTGKQLAAAWDGDVLQHSYSEEAPWEVDANEYATLLLDKLEAKLLLEAQQAAS